MADRGTLWFVLAFLLTFSMLASRSEAFVVQFETAASSAVESDAPAVVKLSLSPAQLQRVMVQYQITGGNATAGEDYIGEAADAVIFNPGETSTDIVIDIVNDGVNEQNETIELKVSHVFGSGAEIGDISEHTYTILDPRPHLQFGAARTDLVERVLIIHRPAVIPVILTVPTDFVVTVDYVVLGGTAVPGEDFILADGTLTFAPGEQSAAIMVDVIDDNIEEDDENISLMLKNQTAGVLISGSGFHNVTIIDSGVMEPPEYDLDQDGEIGFGDVVALLDSWLDCTLKPVSLCSE